MKQVDIDAPYDIAVDFETTGKKPYVDGHRIVSCSVSDGVRTIAFPVTDDNIALLQTLLTQQNVGKMGHSIKFEDMWANVRLKTQIRPWIWDTSDAAHILDNREKVAGLKFQAFVNFGILDYSSNIAKYLDVSEDEDEKDANAFNEIDKAPIDELLLYNGMDALITFRLYQIQTMKIDRDDNLKRAHELFHAGLFTMAEIEQTGINIDVDYVNRQYKHLERRLERMKKELDESDEIQRWKRQEGEKFKLSSDVQLGKFLMNDLKLDLPKTKTGRPSVTQEILEDIADEAPFVEQLVAYEGLKKIRNTELKGLLREAPDGILHPFFNLDTVSSYRSSSSQPNFQSYSKRNEEHAKITRRAFVPRKGHKFLEFDFKGIEVGTSACVHKDPMLIRYVSDKTTDMHRDMCMQIYMLDKDEWVKEIRQLTKSKFVFPEFYGSYYAQVAPDLWKGIKHENLKTKKGVSLYDHLLYKGIKNFKQFEKHVQEIENDFWNVRFIEYTNWKKRHMREYEKKGYFYLLTGFLIQGVLRRNQALNLPIQGPAFHLLLFTINRVREIAHKEKWLSKLVGQIHDSALVSTHPDEETHVIETFNRIVHDELPERFPWIAVPMEVSVEKTEIDQAWFYKKEQK